MILWILAIILFLPFSANATTWYVKKPVNGGSDVFNCTDAQDPLKAKETIKAALLCAGGGSTSGAGAGHIVEVFAGTYTETLNEGVAGVQIPGGTAGNYFTLKAHNSTGGSLGHVGPDGDDVVIQGGTATLFSFADWQSSVYVRIQGIHFRAGDAVMTDTTTMLGLAKYVDFYGNRFSNAYTNIICCGSDFDKFYYNSFDSMRVATISGSQGNFEYGGEAIYWSTSDSIFEGNKIFNVPFYGMHVYRYCSGPCNYPSRNIIRYNEVYNYGQHGYTPGDPNNQVYPPLNGGVGILASTGDANQVYGNLIHDASVNSSENTGMQLAFGQTNTQAYNNTIVRGGKYGLSIGNYGGILRNNIVVGSTVSDVSVATGVTPTYSNNLCSQKLTECAIVETNLSNIFVNLAIDFHLKSTSPARDVGTNTLYPPLDLANITRPQPAGGTVDIGAYEYSSAASPPVVVINQPAGCTGTSTACTMTTASLTLQGTMTASGTGQSVTWTCDRCGSGTASGTASWTITPITLHVGINVINVYGTDSNGKGSDQIAITYAPTHPGDAMVLAFGFEEGSGNNLTDSSGAGNGGTLQNGAARVTNGKYGTGILLDGINDYILVNHSNTLDFTRSFSISAWVQPRIVNLDPRSLVFREGSGSGSIPPPYAMYSSVDSWQCGSAGAAYSGIWTNGTVGPGYKVCAAPLQPGLWTHLAVSYDMTNLIFYVNGIAVQTTPATGYLEPTIGNLLIGASSFAGEYFDGIIDELRIHNRAIPRLSVDGQNAAIGAACVYGNPLDLNHQSVVQEMNCPVVSPAPPLAIKFPASATALKLCAGAACLKLGTAP